MNKVVIMGRFTRDPDIRYTQGQDQMCTARFTLAVDRRVKAQEGQQSADFISCVAFRKTAEFIEKYMKQGIKVVASGRIQTGSYTNREGQKVYTTDVVVDDIEFAESKASQGAGGQREQSQDDGYQRPSYPEGDSGFMNIPDGIDEELPFN